MRQPRFYFEIFLASLAAILIEITSTRLFSIKVFYYFSYVIIGLGLMGLGAGGVIVAVSERLRRRGAAEVVAVSSILGSALTLGGYLVIGPMPLNTSMLSVAPFELVKLAVVCVVLTLPFVCVGVVLATIFSAHPQAVNRLYATDLFGAALGCALAIPILQWIDPPRTLMVAACALAVSGVSAARRHRRLLVAAAVTLVTVAVPATTGRLLSDPVVDRSLSYEEYRENGFIQFSEWNPVFRIDVAECHPVLCAGHAAGVLRGPPGGPE
jgi:hypothetical protein